MNTTFVYIKHSTTVVLAVVMSIVRHLAKLKEKKDKELREEAEVNNDEGTGVLVADTNEDPIQDMIYTETCLGSVDFEGTQVAAASIVPNKRGRYQKSL